MAFYLLKIHKVIQTMSKKRMAQKIADTLRTRMLGKSPVCHNSVVGKKAKCWKAANSAGSGAKSKFPGKKNLSSRCSSRVWQDARENISQKELLVWGLSPVGFEPTADCLGGSYSIQLSYWLMCLKPGDFKVFARFQCDSYGFILVLL